MKKINWYSVFKVAWGLFWLGIIGCAFWAIANFIEADENTEYRDVKATIPIVALTDRNIISGEHKGFGFVDSGKFSDVLYYGVLILNEDTNKMLYKTLNALETELYEYDVNSGETPHLEVIYRIRFVYDEMKPDFFLKFPDQHFKGYCDLQGEIKNITIHAPKGTIDKSFKINFSEE